MSASPFDRRRAPSDSSYPPRQPSSSSSAYSRYMPTPSTSSTARAPSSTVMRADTPPASTYFSPMPAGSHQEPRAAPDAGAHFAYSTTLRRHHVDEPLLEIVQNPQTLREEGAAGLWQRVINTFTKKEERGGYAQMTKDASQETASAKFAHYTIEDTVAHFHTSATHGLSASVVPSLLAQHGYNEFSVASPEPALIKFAKTIYESPLILLLCGSAVVSAVMGNLDDAVSITLAVLIVLTVGFVQERRSEESLEALNKLVPHHSHIVRDGTQLNLLANELVPGDLVTFTTGDRVPADIRIVHALDLEIDESSLTGETTARRKSAETCSSDSAYGVPGEPVALAERSCIGYMGTLVRNGRGSGIVIATGKETEFGVIFSMMEDVEEKRTPLQLSMDELATKLSMISFGIIGVICLIGVLQHRSWLEMFTIGVSLAVAAIPEGLPIVTTVTLALGVLRMSKRKAIVKKLHSVEALGSVSVICSDKTGTLTMNEQTVTEIYVVDEVIKVEATVSLASRLSPAARKVIEVGALCNNATLNEQRVYVGQATDVALCNVLSVYDIPDPRSTFTRTAESPFNSEVKSMSISGTHATGGTLNGVSRDTYYTKGALDALLDRCKFYHVADGSTPPLDAGTRASIISRAQTTATHGLRVVGMAYGFDGPDASTSRPATPAGREQDNLVFVGFQAMRDPPRRGVADSISLLQNGGVQVVMITGDAAPTALAIARDLGLRVGRAPQGLNELGVPLGHSRNASVASYCLTGAQIDKMSKAQLREAVGGVSVFARTTPRHKMAIVEAFQARGAVVGMTGDGVNDAPALKMADIGISMGKSGTDVAKEAADMILVDDNFSTILPAVEEGKSIFHNIQNFLSFQLSTAAAALTLITLSTMFGLSNPLNAMQILFINILMDGPPSQSLGVDPVDPAVMRKPPRRKNEPIITRRLLYRVLFSASIIVAGTLFLYAYALSDEHMSRHEQTMTFTCFVLLDLVSAIQNRGLGCGLTQNRMLITTVSISLATQLALVYVPFMQAIFQTQSLGSNDLFTLATLAGISFGLHEMRRRYERSLDRGGSYTTAIEEMA